MKGESILEEVKRKCSKRLTKRDLIRNGIKALEEARVLEVAKEWARNMSFGGCEWTVEDLALSLSLSGTVEHCSAETDDPASNRSLESDCWAGIAEDIRRIADALAPAAPDVIGTPYVAKRLGCTTVWVTEMVRTGEIPQRCIVDGTGNGKPWKFHRRLIDRWIESR